MANFPQPVSARRNLLPELNEAAEAIDINRGAAQTNSNTVIFEMMNFYKRKLEESEKENEELTKKIKTMQAEHLHDIHALETQLDRQVHTNFIFAQTNMQQAETVMRKHQAGVRLARCFDEMAAAIELVEETHVGDEAMALRYIYMKKEEVMQRANVALHMLIRPSEEEDRVQLDLAIEEEIIDLTGEDTEEETDED